MIERFLLSTEELRAYCALLFQCSLLNKMRAYLLIILAAGSMLSGCAAPALSLHYDYSDSIENTDASIKFEDARPESEKLPEVLSYSISSDKYGIYQLGDSQLTPDRIKYLSSRIKMRAGGKLDGEKLIVRRFLVFNNQQGVLRSAALSAGVGGALGAAMSGAFSKDIPYIETELKIEIGSKLLSSDKKKNLIVRYKDQPVREVISEGIKASIDAAADDVVSQWMN